MHTHEPHESVALGRGHTLAINATSHEYDLEGWCDPSADFEGRFKMTCGDTGELLAVNGWLFSVEAA